ncbi:MAG TPA: hypothetical protein VNH84_00295, partial [Candidatus Saccharimonadales bacterium]|nr:hypothetical protein [Candidatus Saccharimonadales bacterium]
MKPHAPREISSAQHRFLGRLLFIAGGFLALGLNLRAAEPSVGVPAGYRLAYTQTFERADSLAEFVFTDPAAWRWAHINDFAALELAQQSKYTPVVRSPFNIALVADRVLEDFVLEADLIQTGKEYGHRDMCLFFGFQSPTNFYYAHIATAADEHAHNVFIVDGAPRIKIAQETTKGVHWGLGVWHKVRLERRGKEGTIQVYFDDLSKPIMTAHNTRFPSGYVGFGSFDDTGMVDNIRIWTPSMKTEKTSFFSRPR